MAGVVAIQSILEIFYENQISCKVFGYSDLSNQKQNSDILEYLEYDGFYQQELRKKEKTFSSMVTDWFGDTVSEIPIFQEIIDKFSEKAKTRIFIMISDFRGHRAKKEVENEINSTETKVLQKMVDEFIKKDYHIIGVQLGDRGIGDYIFPNIIYINEENFFESNENLWEEIKKIFILKKLI